MTTPSPGPIVELRQYTLHSGQRDVLIELFDREFVESQETSGMRVLGQFRDADRPDRFVWLRSFGDMVARAAALGAFYGGPVWKAHRNAANATMQDSSDVLLLRPIFAGAGFALAGAMRPPPGASACPPSIVVATICCCDRPIDGEMADRFAREVVPWLEASGPRPLACLGTEYADNTFPALPVRTGEHILVWFTRFAERSEVHDRGVPPGLSAYLRSPPQRLLLQPTSRSLLR